MRIRLRRLQRQLLWQPVVMTSRHKTDCQTSLRACIVYTAMPFAAVLGTFRRRQHGRVYVLQPERSVSSMGKVEIIISAKEDMFSSLFICVSVVNFAQKLSNAFA